MYVMTAAAELERRYREGQAVYEEVMLHRPPGVSYAAASKHYAHYAQSAAIII